MVGQTDRLTDRDKGRDKPVRGRQEHTHTHTHTHIHIYTYRQRQISYTTANEREREGERAILHLLDDFPLLRIISH